MSDESRYFGTAGHCIDIDGGFWHRPGECTGAAVNCSGKCCGYITPTAVSNILRLLDDLEDC